MRSAPTQVPETAAAADAEVYQPGELVDKKHRLVRPLGKGGMGTLWVAHNLVLDVHMAVKLIGVKESSTSTKQLRERLLQEARAAAKLGHPAIVRVFDFGISRRGDPFVVMELLHGETLADILHRETRLPAARAIQTMLPIADALMAAHGKGIVHRDVKPENVILAKTEDGRVQPKLLDFGIASFIERGPDTATGGLVVGTPAYMSPEQAMAKPDIGPASDIWSLCVVLYELMAGKLPFDGETYPDLAAAILDKPAKPLHELGIGDEALWAIISKGFEKEPENRWPDVKSLGAALARWLCERNVWDDICNTNLGTTWLELPTVDASEPALSTVSGEVSLNSPAMAGAPASRVTPHVTIGEVPAAVDNDPRRQQRTFQSVLLAALATLLLGSLAAFALWRGRAPAPEASGTDAIPGARMRAQGIRAAPGDVGSESPEPASSDAEANRTRPIAVESLPTTAALQRRGRPAPAPSGRTPVAATGQGAATPRRVQPPAKEKPEPPTKKVDFGF